MKNAFGAYHPVVNLTFLVSAVAFSLLLVHPVFLALSLTSSLAFTLALKKKRALKFDLLFALPLFAAIAVLNPFFVHQGFTMLFYIDDNPVTLEAIDYGVALAASAVSAVLWLSCCNELFSADKIIWLFGRAVPFLGLLISMTLRLIPRMGRQLRRIARAQRSVGMGADWGGPWRRIRNGVRMLSMLVTWTMENLIEASDSMKARGYGLPGYKSFSVFRFGRRDGVCLAVLGASILLCLIGTAAKSAAFQYYPYLKWAPISTYFFVMAGAYAFLCFLPTAFEIREDLKWRSLRSNI